MLAVLGATGYTGRLALTEARRLGIPLRLVGRRADALARVAQPGEEIRVADARDRDALARAFEGASVVASLAGPFTELGMVPLEAALAAGAHWVDTSGEQAFAQQVYERFGSAERVVLTSFGFDYVPGDLAARLAAEGAEPVGELVVGYSVKGFLPSPGTVTTIAGVITQSQVSFVDGRLVPSRFGETTRIVRFPFGVRKIVEWGGTEPLTVPRHTQVRTVRTGLKAPGIAAYAGRVAPVVAPLARLAGRIAPAPPERLRSRTRFVVVAEAYGAGARRAVVRGGDVYALTGRLVAVAADALLHGRVSGSGALAPAQAFDVRELAAQLAPLLEIGAVGDV